MKETLTRDILNLINGYSADYEAPVRYTKPEQFGDIDASTELDLFQDEYSELFV